MAVEEPKRPEMEMMDLTGGRPGAIIETEEQLQIKDDILEEIETGERIYPEWIDKYGEPELDEEEEGYEGDDDPEAIAADELGSYDIFDLKSKFDYEWTPESGDPDPNLLDPELEYVKEPPKDEDGVEKMWDPIFGPSSPIDERTIISPVDSYMIAEDTRDDSLLDPVFPEGDLEIAENEEFVKFRRSLRIIDTYIDPFLQNNIEVPRHVAKWHGYPEQLSFEEKPYTNNRFTEPDEMTDFDSMTPYRARKTAVEMARAKNSEWLKDGISQKWHQEQRAPYEKYGTLVGTLRKGDINPEIKQEIEPALKVLGSVAELLSIDEGVFRFHYHGLMKNKFGMARWTELMIRDCGVECTSVIFETGFRKRDPIYDGAGPWYGPY